MKYSKIIIIILFFFNIQAFSQSAINFDFFGLGYHPFDNPNYIIYENSISSDGSWVIEPGIIISYQKFILLTHTSIQLNQGLYSDAAAQFAGYTGLSLKRKFFHIYKHSFSFALGAAYLYRDKWNDISRYVPEYDFVSGKKFETKFSYTCEFKYYYYLGKEKGVSRSDFNIGFFYGHQFETFTFTLGYRYWINPNVKIRKKCDDCGSKKFNRKKIKMWFKRNFKF